VQLKAHPLCRTIGDPMHTPGSEQTRPKRTLVAFALFNVFCIGSGAALGAGAATAYFLYSGVPGDLGIAEAIRTLSIPSPWAGRILIPAFSIGALLGAYLWAHTMRRTQIVPPETIRRFVGRL
jgi:hypothetical protein